MPVALLFTGLTRHPKIRRAGEKAGWLFVCCLEYCAEHGTDGFIPTEAFPAFGLSGLSGRLKALLLHDDRLGPLLHPVDGGYEIHDYLEWNRTAHELAERRSEISKARSEAGKRGAAKRWAGKLDGKRDGKAIASAKQPDSPVPLSGPSSGLDGPSTKPKRRASHPTADHQESEDQPLDPLLTQTVERVCAMRPDWKPVLVRGAAVRAAGVATSSHRAALALLCVASDPTSKLPIRVLSAGWWWDENDTRFQRALDQMEEVA